MTEKKYSGAEDGHEPVAIPSRFQLKASYQRHMSYGMLGALLLTALPVVVLAYWPAASGGDPGDVVRPDDAPDTIVVDWRRVSIERQKPDLQPSPSGGGQKAEGEIVNPFVRPEMVDDDADIDEGELGGLTQGGGFGPDTTDIWNPVPGDGGGVVFVPDTNEYEMGAVDAPPALIAMETPDYPPTAKRVGVEGKVLLHVLVGTDGKALDVRIYAEEPEGFGFGEYAARAARMATFGPAVHKSQAVRCWVSFPVVFELESCR